MTTPAAGSRPKPLNPRVTGPALALRLGEEGLAAYMATHGVDRRTAIARVRVTHRVGRRPSASDRDDGDR